MSSIDLTHPWTALSTPRRKPFIARLGVMLAGSALLLLTGCGPHRLKTDFVGYESSYAETSNREVLLNLARLQNHDPTYFFKIGQISSLYKMQASVSGNASYALQSTNVNIGGPTGGGIPVANYENDPSFTFIPVNDETNAKFLLQPIDPETFYALYQQGWRVDQLFRLMVDRIELTTVSSPGVCEVETFRNLPPMVHPLPNGTMAADYVRDSETLSRYVTFLRISAVLYALQQRGDLILSGANAFIPFDENSSLSDSQTASPGSAGSGTTPDPKSSKTPGASDLITAMEKNAVWEQNPDTHKWLLGQKLPSAVFYLNHYKGGGPHAANADLSDTDRIRKDILADPEMRALKQNNETMLKRVLSVLANGFSITSTETAKNSNVGPCPPNTKGISSHLVLRSLLGIMAAAAQEQSSFETLLRDNPPVAPIPLLDQSDLSAEPETSGSSSYPLFKDEIPPVELLPLLHLTGSGDGERTAPLVQISYRGKSYHVADLKYPDPASPENQYWNRDVFRLVNQLTSQVTVDISKFPLPAILQLNAQ